MGCRHGADDLRGARGSRSWRSPARQHQHQEQAAPRGDVEQSRGCGARPSRLEEPGLVFDTRRWDHFRTAWEGLSSERSSLTSTSTTFGTHFASWAVQPGASLQEVRDLLGHHSLAMTLRYGHLAPEHLRTAVSASTPRFPCPARIRRKVQRKRLSSRECCSRSSFRCWCAWQESNLRPSD